MNPRKQKESPALRDVGEIAAVRVITRLLPKRSDIIAGAGDDSAVVRWTREEDLVLTSDPVIEGVHFMPATPPALVGHKAIGRVLSDLAAMGARPRWALINIVAPGDMRVHDVKQLYAGINRLALRHGLAVVGGDLSHGPVLEVHAFAAGTVPRGKAVLRAGAGAGDRIFVTGHLGGSLKSHHLRFEPRVREGMWLRTWATSMMDLSDGLVTDLDRLIRASGVGASVHLDAIPLSPALRSFRRQADRVRHALCDGEDFELLFTVKGRRVPEFRKAWKKAFSTPCTEIGSILRHSEGLRFVDERSNRSLSSASRGYEHFR
jgi:thiamine-monophosphate kinase